MAFETKNFFNSTIKQIYQQTGAILSLSTRSDKQLLINSLKLFEANFIYNWQKIHYPLLHGPSGSPYEKYTGMRSKPWAEYDALDSVYGGISGWTITAEPWATEDGIPALWDETNKQPHSITGALYYLSQRIEDLTVENDQTEAAQYDDREVKADIACLEKNLETVYKDVYGCGYTLDCDGGKQNQFSVQTHLFQIFDQLIDGGPQLSIDGSCEDIYPSMSIYMPTSGLTYDVKIPNSQVEGACGTSLQDDLNLIHSYIGLNNCETSPTYSDYGTLNYLTDGNSLEESLWDLDNAIGSFSPTKTLAEAYIDGYSDIQNRSPGSIRLANASGALDKEGIALIHSHTKPTFQTGASTIVLNDNMGEFFKDYYFRISDMAISGYQYVGSFSLFNNLDADRWHNSFTVGEHEVGRNAGVNLPDPSLKFGDFLYPSVHLYRSILNQTPTAGIPRTREFGQTYSGYTAYTMDETAIWVATGTNRSGTPWVNLPEAEQPLDCAGEVISANNLYYREPGDGTIYKLNKCNEVSSEQEVEGVYGTVTSSVSNVMVVSTRADTGQRLIHGNVKNALTVRLSSVGDSKVGVATSDPQHTLHVKPPSGNARLVLESDDNSSDVEMRLDSASNTRNAFITFRNSDLVVGGVGYSASDQVTKLWGSNNHNDDHLCVVSSGAVGIGTATPTEKLDVSGGIRVGNSTGTNAGTIRWSGTDLEAYKAGGWVSLTAAGGGSGISNVVEDTSPQLGGDLDIYSGSNHFGFKDSSSADVSPLYRFYGKDAVGEGSDRPAKIRLYGGGPGSNSLGINVDFNIASDYDIRLPPSSGSMGQVLKVTGTTGATVLGWGSISYNDLSNQPTIPTNNNELTNGAGYLTSVDLNGLTGTTGTVSKFAIVSSGSSRTITPANIDISIFNNDAGYLTSLGTAIVDADFSSNGIMKRTGNGSYATITDNSSNWDTAYSWGDHSSAGYTSNAGTVTSITPGADSGTGTAITGSGSINIEGGTNVTTSVSGTTVTINATGGGSAPTFGSIAFDLNSGDEQSGRNIHSSGNLSVFNETRVHLFRSGGTDARLQFNVEKGYSVGDTLLIQNRIESNIFIEAVASNSFSNSPTLQAKFKGYYPAVNVGGNSECQFGNITSSSLSTYEIIKLPGNSIIKLHCTDVTSSSATFEVHEF